MRFIAAYYLLLIYLTVMFQPYIPSLIDTLSHTFNEEAHIATVHAKYGSHHLEVAMAKSGNETGKAQNTVRVEDQVPVHTVVSELNCDNNFTPLSISFYSLEQPKLSSVLLMKHTPPPKIS